MRLQFFVESSAVLTEVWAAFRWSLGEINAPAHRPASMKSSITSTDVQFSLATSNE